jgi:hypothetical protein
MNKTMDAIYITRCPFLEHPGNRHQTHYSNAVAVGCIMKAKEAHPLRYAVVPIPCQYRKGLNARRFGDRISGLYVPVDRRTCRRARRSLSFLSQPAAHLREGGERRKEEDPEVVESARRMRHEAAAPRKCPAPGGLTRPPAPPRGPQRIVDSTAAAAADSAAAAPRSQPPLLAGIRERRASNAT